MQSRSEIYHVDRHVEAPPVGLPASAACSAGVALLLLWHNELKGDFGHKLFFEGPVLVIDQSWLDEKPEAPPPHVVLDLAKRGDVLQPIGTHGRLVDPNNSPIREPLPSVSIHRVDRCAARESDGSWLFRIK